MQSEIYSGASLGMCDNQLLTMYPAATCMVLCAVVNTVRFCRPRGTPSWSLVQQVRCFQPSLWRQYYDASSQLPSPYVKT